MQNSKSGMWRKNLKIKERRRAICSEDGITVNVLVVYHSRTGNTKTMTETVADAAQEGP
ncbi:MAG: hypothetical protein ACXW1N_04855 [Halobacteriota archaeon]